MAHLIEQIRTTVPFDGAEAQICAGPCQGCSLKLLGFLESELDDWEARINEGDRPGLAELSQLIRTSRKIARVLEKAGLMDKPPSDEQQGTSPPLPPATRSGKRQSPLPPERVRVRGTTTTR